MSYSDEHIYIKALAEGDKDALNWLFRQFSRSIFHYCLKFLKDQPLAEEATADVFLKIWEKREMIDQTKSIQPFLYKIAKDTAYSYLRKVASNERLKQKFLENYQKVDYQDGEWIYLQKEHAERIDQILDTLPPQRQLIFKMRYFDGKDNPSIAKEHKLSIHTVKSQLVKARTSVRRQLSLMGFSNIYLLMAILYWMEK